TATMSPRKFSRQYVFHLHDRLQTTSFPLFESTFQHEVARLFEGEFAASASVERAVNDIDLYIDHRVTAQDAVEHRFLDTLFHGRNVFARNDAADDLVFNDQTFAALGWAHVDFHVSILAAAP